MRRALPLPLLLLAIGLLALAGCGGSSNSSNTTSTSTNAGGTGTTTDTTTAPAATSTPAVRVKMQNIAFSPADIRVKVGQKITWTNADTVDHNVTSTKGEHVQSDNFGKGGTFTFAPTKAGTLDYTCTIHPGMDGKIVVVK